MEAIELIRLDVLVARQCGFSREYSREAVEQGFVMLNGKALTKPGMKLPADTTVEVSAPPQKYVSRGGLKLEKAVAIFGVSVHNDICIDIGASTGGFTDCLLQAGAAKVFAIDSGTEQLVESLRSDPRVVPMENTNIREVTPETIGVLADCIVIDVSFISLDKVLPHAAALLAPDGKMIALVKPQFEAGRAHLNKKGVVTDPKVRKKVLDTIVKNLQTYGLEQHGCIPSPILGQNGNEEYLLYLRATNGRPYETNTNEGDHHA